MEGRAGADVLRKDDGQDEGAERVDVHAELQGRERVACQEGEEAVEAGDLVEEDHEGGELGSCAEGEEVEEGLGMVRASVSLGGRAAVMGESGGKEE